MAEFLLEQALFHGPGPGQYQLRTRSPGFRDEWLAAAERLCDGFGERPVGVACPACLFVQPLDRRHVVVVQVADQAASGLGFHFLVLPRTLYGAVLQGNPFEVVERCPPPWHATDSLAALSWPGEVNPAPRMVAEVQRILKQEDGPTFLGAAQALVDGSCIVFERPSPDLMLLRDLWTLLPTSTRTELWPATFAFSNALGFHALVTPHADGKEFEDYLREDQAGDYPEGHYESALQFAAEHGDQSDLDRLFARRSRMETFRLGVLMLGASVVVLLILSLIKPPAPKAEPKATKPQPGGNIGKDVP